MAYLQLGVVTAAATAEPQDIVINKRCLLHVGLPRKT